MNDSATANPIEVRRATENDVAPLEFFYHRHHPGRARLLNMQTWRWEFLENPNSSQQPAFFVIEKNGEIHGGIGYLAVRLQLGERVFSAGHPVNHFVDPAFIGLPALRLMRLCLRDYPIAYFSYLTDDAVRLAKATGFVDLSPHLTHYYLPLRRPSGDAESASALGLTKYLVLKFFRTLLYLGAWVRGAVAGGGGELSISEQLPPPEQLANIAQPRRDRFRVIKDGQYLHWRYARSPVLNCKYVTLREGDLITALAVIHFDHLQQQAFILDILQRSPHVSQLLRMLVAVIDCCRQAGVQTLSTHILHPEIEQALRNLGFGHQQSGNRFMVYAADKNLKLEISDAQKWEFFLGDTDVF